MESYTGFFEGDAFYGGVGLHNLSAELSGEPCQDPPLTAFHVLLTAPWRYWNPGKPFWMHDTALLTARLSALLWRKYNGPVYLMTDDEGAAYFRERKLDTAYNGILPILDGRNFGISPKKFWAAGKIQALTKMKAPCILLDMDMIVWRPLDLKGCSLAVTHSEHIIRQFYPELSFFKMSRAYEFPKEWDENAEPLNTSLLYIKEDWFREYYTDESIRFMQYERETPDDGVRCMVFAEQRILGMCAEAKGIMPRLFLNYEDPLEKQSLMTHVWSAKRILQKSNDLAEKYQELAVEKIACLMQMTLV